ncbi:MAG: hypothetical protein ACYS0H_05780 [Planctomycetota bacterium]
MPRDRGVWGEKAKPIRRAMPGNSKPVLSNVEGSEALSSKS